jgi:hypothetical protein
MSSHKIKNEIYLSDQKERKPLALKGGINDG